MPKVKITDKKGLVQESGSGVQVQSITTFENTVQFDGGNTFHGHLNKVEAYSPGAVGADAGSVLVLSASDSGKTFILGDDSASYTLAIPAKVGWTGRFTFSGSAADNISNNLFLSASTDFGFDGDALPFRGICLKVDGTASAKIDENLGRVRFVASSGPQGGDFVDVEVVKAGVIIYSGLCIG